MTRRKREQNGEAEMTVASMNHGGSTPLIEDRNVSVPEIFAPTKVLVYGTTMDYHGDGVPLPALRRLASRVDDPNLAGPTGEGTIVGVVDTPMCAHPWLEGGYLAAPADFMAFDPEERNSTAILQHMEGHSTFIAGLVLQQAPAAAVWVEHSLDATGKASADTVALAARTLASRGAHVLNLSLGSYDDTPDTAETLRTMTRELLNEFPELVIVASAGNKAPTDESREFWPAAVSDERVVAVGSVSGDATSNWADWSNRGDWVDLAANGRKVLSTYIDRTVRTPDDSTVEFEGWARWSGTSFSAAIVSGAIAAEITRGGAQSAVAAVRALKGGSRRTTADGVPVIERRCWDTVIENKKAQSRSGSRRRARHPSIGQRLSRMWTRGGSSLMRAAARFSTSDRGQR